MLALAGERAGNSSPRGGQRKILVEGRNVLSWGLRGGEGGGEMARTEKRPARVLDLDGAKGATAVH